VSQEVDLLDRLHVQDFGVYATFKARRAFLWPRSRVAMRTAILLGLILTTALRTTHAQRVTVQELEQVLASSAPPGSAKTGEIGNTDLLDQINREDSLAPRMSGLELTERLTSVTRAHLITKYKLGPLTQSALELLADRSALLDPPLAEIAALPPPEADAQKTMMRQTSAFVFQTLTHLPDFFALLTTTKFEDGPVIVGGQTLTAEPHMRLVGSSRKEITFSDGKETFDSSRLSLASKLPRGEGLESQGEFGAEAAIVFIDLKQGSIAFHHWETNAAGTVAVFRYAVPQTASHYEVKYACHGNTTFHAQPAYHGTLSIDPATGVLVRFTLQAASDLGDPITKVASAIEYGAVVLGERRYFCPMRSLAFTVEEADTCSEAHKRRLVRPVAMLNRIVFSDYHKLGSEMVIVPGSQQGGKPSQEVEGADPNATAPPPQAPPAVPAPHLR
jgi:hypothetical protein